MNSFNATVNGGNVNILKRSIYISLVVLDVSFTINVTNPNKISFSIGDVHIDVYYVSRSSGDLYMGPIVRFEICYILPLGPPWTNKN